MDDLDLIAVRKYAEYLVAEIKRYEQDGWAPTGQLDEQRVKRAALRIYELVCMEPAMKRDR